MEKKVEEKEIKFQEAMKNWVATNEKKYYDEMWFCVYDCIENIMKSKAFGIRVPCLTDKAMDATCKVMNKILNDGVRPEKLSSYCYLWAIGALYDKKTAKWERTESFDDTFDNYAYSEEEGIYNICRGDY